VAGMGADCSVVTGLPGSMHWIRQCGPRSALMPLSCRSCASLLLMKWPIARLSAHLISFGR
jgi:hypothetical protein